MNIKEFAEMQWEKWWEPTSPQDLITVWHNGYVVDPWHIEDKEVTTKEAIEILGIDKFAQYCGEVAGHFIFDGEPRTNALKQCYSIPGYEELPLEQKNKIYDEIIRRTRC